MRVEQITTAPDAAARPGRRSGALRFLPGAAGIVALVAIMATAVLSIIPTSDTVFLPAPAEAIDTHITIPGHPLRPGRGTLSITFIYEQSRVNLLTRLWDSLNPDASIYTSQQLYGPGPAPTQQQQQQVSIKEMLDSKTDAEVAALNALGYPIAGEEIVVGQIDPHSNANGVLRVGDIIVSANGHAVHTLQGLVQAERGLRPGDSIAVVVRRLGAGPLAGGRVQTARTFTARIKTLGSNGRAIIGIVPTTAFSALPKLPFTIAIDSGDIGGPSAGLMFALAIYNRLSPVDLTHGHKIAGTGMIDADGYVGSIGGVKQKVIGAHQSGAQYFFVPQSESNDDPRSYADARSYAAANGITLVPVSTLQQAIDVLRRLH